MKPSLLLRSLRLPKLPIAMPTEGRFAVDAAGAAKPPTHESLAKTRSEVLANAAPITKDAFWKMPIHDGLKYIAKTCSYFRVADIAMQHSFFSLFEDMLSCPDAPLPHVIYTDLLKCKTFATLQSPPDEQFSLDAKILRSLLQMASFHLLHDPHYFASVERLFRTIELQQTVGSEVLSAWVQCCVFAGKTAMAVHTLDRMEDNRVPFDAEVFCSMMAPTSAGPTPASSRGDAAVRLAHQRLFTSMSSNCSPSAVGVHAAFVANSLLMRHANKWEVLRSALVHPTGRVDVAHRTLDLAAAVLEMEKGVRCGPKTSEALAVAFAQQGTAEAADSLFRVLYYMRSVEALPQYASEPMATFSDAAAETIAVALRRTAKEQPSKRLVCSSAMYLMDHTAAELRQGVRPDGPLARTLRTPSDDLQFGELLSLMGYGDAQRGGSVAEPNSAVVGHGGGGALVAPSSDATEMAQGGDGTEPQVPIAAQEPSLATGGHTVSRLAEQERSAQAKEAWARARLASAWMNPSMVVPQ